MSAQREGRTRCGAQIIDDLSTQGLVWAGSGRPSVATFDDRARQGDAIPLGIPEIDQALPGGGLQRGSIHEFFYNDPLQPCAFPTSLTSAIAHSAHELIANQQSWNEAVHPRSTLWIGKRSWPTPYTLVQAAKDHGSATSPLLHSALFIDTINDRMTLWALETALRSPAVHVVIADCPRLSLTATKKLLLAARQNGATALLIRNSKDSAFPSCAHTRWALSPTPSSYDTPLWELSLLKIRGAALQSSSWLIGINEHESSLSLRLFPRVVDRCHEAKTTQQEYGT
jgi:protein ImuA